MSEPETINFNEDCSELIAEIKKKAEQTKNGIERDQQIKYAQNMVSLTNFKIVSLSSELSKARSTAKKETINQQITRQRLMGDQYQNLADCLRSVVRSYEGGNHD